MASAKMEVRLSKIEAFVGQQGGVKISDIADHLQVSESTTRRDIEYLIAQKVLIKNYGFVALSNAKTTLYDNPFLRKNINVQVKVALAEKAASLICDGDIIYIESGTKMCIRDSKYGEYSGRYVRLRQNPCLRYLCSLPFQARL